MVFSQNLLKNHMNVWRLSLGSSCFSREGLDGSAQERQVVRRLRHSMISFSKKFGAPSSAGLAKETPLVWPLCHEKYLKVEENQRLFASFFEERLRPSPGPEGGLLRATGFASSP